MPAKYRRKATRAPSRKRPRKTTWTKRRKTYSSKSSRRNYQQRIATAGLRMKFTTVVVPRWTNGSSTASWTVGLLGGKGDPTKGTYYNITDCNPAGKLALQAFQYQQFTITGVAMKMISPEPTTSASSPVQFSCSYSPQYLIRPDLTTDSMQSLSSYQTGATNQNKPISKYFPLSYTKTKLGIDYAPCDELYGINAQSGEPSIADGAFAKTDQPLYNG